MSHDHPDSLRPLIRVVWEKQVTLLARYRVNTVSLFVSMFVFFLLIFFGGQALTGPAFTESADGIVVGFFLWTVATRAFRTLTGTVTREAQWGTLERLFTSPYGVGTVMAVEAVVAVCLTMLWGGAMLFATMAVTGRWLVLDLPTLLPLVLSTVAPLVGLGFALAGLAVRFKRIENLLGLLTFGFVGLIAAPVGRYPLLAVLPMVQGSHLTRTAMVSGTRLWEFPAADLVVLVGVAVGYLLVGFAGFRRSARIAREQGLLNDY